MNPLRILKHTPHILRKKFSDKYILIESDDWGLERTLNKESIAWLEKKFGKEKLTRWTYDSLETSDDLKQLFNILQKYRDRFENPPVITANFITHNIDYSSNNGLNFIPLSKGFNKESEDVRNLYREGIEGGYIFPQLHGYSHYNLRVLKEYCNTSEGAEAYSNKILPGRSTVRGNLAFLQGELSIDNTEFEKLTEASDEFEKFFGFYSKSIIPPAYIFDIECADSAKKNGITFIQSSNRLLNTKKKRYKYPYFQKRKGMYWSVRNSRLDPHPDYKFYSDQCVSSIERAFKYKYPAVIDFHRVNFAGRFAPEYRDKTFLELDDLLKKIFVKWPDAKFIHSQKLNDILWQQ